MPKAFVRWKGRRRGEEKKDWKPFFFIFVLFFSTQDFSNNKMERIVPFPKLNVHSLSFAFNEIEKVRPCACSLYKLQH